MVNDIIDTYTVQAGNGDEGNVSLLVLVGQKEHLHGNNCIVDTDGSLRWTIMKFPLSCKQIPITGV